jgi:hypothetical protein
VLTLVAASARAAANATSVHVVVSSLPSVGKAADFSQPVAVATGNGWAAAWGEDSRLAVSETKTGAFQAPVMLTATLPGGAHGLARLDDPVALAAAPDGTLAAAWTLDDLSTAKANVPGSWSQWVVYAARTPQGRWSQPVAVAGRLPSGIQRLRLFPVKRGFVLSFFRILAASTSKRLVWRASTFEVHGSAATPVPQARGPVWQAGSNLLSMWSAGGSVYLARRDRSGWSLARRIASGTIDDPAAVLHADVAVDPAGAVAAVLHRSGDTVRAVVAQPSGAVAALTFPGGVFAAVGEVQVVGSDAGFAFTWMNDVPIPGTSQQNTVAMAASWTPAAGATVKKLGNTNGFSGPRLTATAAGVVAYWSIPTRVFASVLHGSSWSQPVAMFPFVLSEKGADSCCVVAGASSTTPELLWVAESHHVPASGSTIHFATATIRGAALAPGGWSAPAARAVANIRGLQSYLLFTDTGVLDVFGGGFSVPSFTVPSAGGGDAVMVDAAGRVGVRDRGRWTFSPARGYPAAVAVSAPVGGVSGGRGALLWLAINSAGPGQLVSVDTASITRS